MAENPLRSQPNLQDLLIQLGTSKVALSQAKYGSKRYKDLLKQVNSLQDSVDAIIEAQQQAKVERKKSQERTNIAKLQEERQRALDLGDTVKAGEVDQQLSRIAQKPVTPGITKPAPTMSPTPLGPVAPVAPVVTPQPPAAPVQAAKAPAAPAKKKTAKEKPKTDAEQYADAVALAQQKYQMPDILFKNVPSLRTLLDRLVNDELTLDQFSREIELDPWYRSNSQEIKNRYVQLYNYQDLVKSGRAQGTTDYEQRINKITADLQARARELRGAEIDPAEARLIAQDLYIFNQDADQAVVTQRLSRFIKPVAGMVAGQPTTGYSGQALQNYQTLQGIAKANGFKIEDILPRDAAGKPMTAEGILQGIATQQIDVNRIAQDARKLAAQGQPDYVKELLAQGYDLENIYAPYKQRMATILEIQNPDRIQLNDPALRMAIGKNGDMNMYEYERALRKDARWQYTENAAQDVANKTLRVLRDFGFEA